MNLSFTEVYQNLVGKQFKEVGCTRNSKKAEVSINRSIKMCQTRLMKVQFSQCRLTVHLVVLGWVDSQIEFRSSYWMLL